MDKQLPKWLRDRLIFAPPTGDKYAPPELVEVEHHEIECDDCHKTVQGPREVTCKKHFSYGGWWAIYCKNCGCYKDPVTGEFCLGKKKLNTTFREFKERKV